MGGVGGQSVMFCSVRNGSFPVEREETREREGRRLIMTHSGIVHSQMGIMREGNDTEQRKNNE